MRLQLKEINNMMFHEALQLVKTNKAKFLCRVSSNAKYGYDKKKKTFLHINKADGIVIKEIDDLRVYISERYRRDSDWAAEFDDGRYKK